MEPDHDALEEDRQQYGEDSLSMKALNDQDEERPVNRHRTLPFHDLCMSYFEPLLSLIGSKGTSNAATKKKVSPSEQRRYIVQRYISRWRKEVGDDFYPALRLMLPEKDRDRAMYGLKEKAIAKLLVNLLKINKTSDDGNALWNWKYPQKGTGKSGDFPGTCHDVLAKRAMRQKPGDLRIAEVNVLLNQLSSTQKEEGQLPIFEIFYNRMNANELVWLIRIILRQMKVGVAEKMILDSLHPDAEALFNVSSSLRRVCWELKDPTVRLPGATGQAAPIELMQCFQPQLAQFQAKDMSFEKMIEKMMGMSEKPPIFWIEEKLDGERMQMHMIEDDSHPGGRRFAWFSRKATEYTYLYGDGFEDDESAVTRHIKNAFKSNVRNIVLDGEMITWDPATNKIVDFGSLKTAALSEKKNLGTNGHRPVFRVFDCLLLNDEVLTPWVLEDRREALEGAVQNVPLRIEVHKYYPATKIEEINVHLREVIAEASEGLVLKNPKSSYELNSRNNNWMKVKPEYMEEFGEHLDCVVIGGYFGSGRRGGNISSFLCGLRVSQNYRDKHEGTNPEKCVSFFKVGGGFKTEDYQRIKHETEGKWHDWDQKKPPDEFIILGGEGKQFERPDVWIKPSDSLVLEVKAASVTASDQFGFKLTLRFPRFKAIRWDKTWEESLTVDEFMVVKSKAEEEASRAKDLKIDTRRLTKKLKKDIVIAGNDGKVKTPYAGPNTKIFEGLNFFVMADMVAPPKKRKAEIEQILKANGGKIFQNPTAEEDIICLGDKRVVKVASLIKSGHTNIVKPSWVFDAVKQAEIDGPARHKFIVPFEPSHMFHMTDEARPGIEDTIDIYGDSYTRDITPTDLKQLFESMIPIKNSGFSPREFIFEHEERGNGFSELRGSMFSRCVVYFAQSTSQELDSQHKIELQICKYRFRFSGGVIAESEDEAGLTHIVVVDDDPETARALRAKLAASRSTRLPRIVSLTWLKDSWAEETLLDEDRYKV